MPFFLSYHAFLNDWIHKTWPFCQLDRIFRLCPFYIIFLAVYSRDNALFNSGKYRPCPFYIITFKLVQPFLSWPCPMPKVMTFLSYPCLFNFLMIGYTTHAFLLIGCFLKVSFLKFESALLNLVKQ